ncbi:MAG: insulinase family protein [Rikenellaceae bacterium]|nr:insulinase family protein [Rikenellaceae bacterium]MCL2692399.1 insulinase family protein [Rikenellaceae bacterium]
MTEYYIHTLSNGIRAVFRRVKSPVAWCALTLNTGSRDELPREAGLAHFTEHMLFKGTARRRPHHINSRLEKLGGELNAFTTKEETVVHATTLRDNFPHATELIADIFFNSTFPEREIARERDVVLDEINSYKDSPTDRIYDEFEDLLFAGSPLGHNILGMRSSVRKFDGASIKTFVERTYNTDQMVFTVAADVSEKTFVRTVERYFGGARRMERSFARETPPPVAAFDKTLARGTHQAHCIIGSCAYSNTDPRRVALALLVNILGGPAANSRLNTLLREKNGLTYSAEAAFTAFSDTGIATIYFGTERDRVGRCRELIDGVLHDMRATALTTRQLAAAKKQLVGQLAISMESREGNVLSAGKSLLIYNEIDAPEAIYRKIEAVTAADILEVANEIFGQTSVLTYGNGGG